MRQLVFALGLAALVGCGGGGSETVAEQPLFTRTGTIPATGGDVSGPEGTATRVVVAGGALAAPLPLTLSAYRPSRLVVPNALARRVSNAVYVRLDPTVLQDGSSLTVELPATASVPGAEGFGVVTDDSGDVTAVVTAYDDATKLFTLTIPKAALVRPKSRARSLVGAVKSFGYTVIGRDLYAEEGRANLKHYVLGLWSSYDAGRDRWANKRVALVLHGMRNSLDDMGDIAEYLASLREQNRRPHYDEVWGFDYGWSDNIASNAVRLAKVLKEVASKATEVDVYGHSMGGLVSRWAIEKEGAGDYVTRLITMGTPSLGVPQAALTALVFTSPLVGSAAYLNGLTWTPGILDLRSDSLFMRQLNDGSTPPSAMKVPYVVLAGNDAAYLPAAIQRPIDDYYRDFAGAPPYDGIVPVESALASGLDRKAKSITRLPVFATNHTNMRGHLDGDGPFGSKNLSLDKKGEHLFRNQILNIGGGNVSIQ